jgi:hypothetical protein
MARSVASGESEKLFDQSEIGDGVLEILDGDRAALVDSPNQSAESGDLLESGDRLILEAKQGIAEFLKPLNGEAVDFQFNQTRRGKSRSGAQTRVIRKDDSQSGNLRPLRFVEDKDRDAGQIIFEDPIDIQYPGTGTAVLEVLLDTSAVLRKTVRFTNPQTGFQGSFTAALRDGQALDSGEWYTITHPVRRATPVQASSLNPRFEYNYEVDTNNVNVRHFTVDFTRRAQQI